MTDELRALGERFAIAGRFAGAEPLGSGHIHATFVSSWERGGARARYVHQRINTRIFGDPAPVMQNIARVTAHLRAALTRRGIGELERRVLTLIAARDGGFTVVAPDGGVWRSFALVEGAVTREIAESAAETFEAARAFADFAGLLADLPAPPLAVTLPGFHDLARRFAEFEDAVARDAAGRAAGVRAEIASTRATHARLREALAACDPSRAPLRVMHHDCKLNNLLFDAQTGEALCVIDLDTVMQGTLLSDFGELVRTATHRGPADETRLETSRFDLSLFEALARGYAAGARAWLRPSEAPLLPLAGPTLALMNAIRFLTDHLAGDVYFRIHREAHNLDRHRAQLTLTERMLERLQEAQRITASALAEVGIRS
jgi:Ser/Thr protein kinase RdoA (MazF antagonist)